MFLIFVALERRMIMKHICRFLGCLAVCLLFCLYGFSQNLRQLTQADGLSSNAVFTLCQDADGMIWVGTLDGLYLYHGQAFTPARFLDGTSMEGHLVESIVASDDSTMWAQSAYGLRKFNRLLAKASVYGQFVGTYRIRKAPDGGVIILDKAGKLHLYRKDLDSFIDLNLPVQPDEELVNIGATEKGVWTAGKQGLFMYPWLTDGRGKNGLGSPVHLYSQSVGQCVFSKSAIYFVGKDGWLFERSLTDSTTLRLFPVREELEKRGRLTGATRLNGRLFLSFEKGGVLRYDLDAPGGESVPVDLGIHSGVFQMVRDRRQDLIWIATDGQGIFMYWEAPFLVRSYLSEDVNPSVDKPVRSLFRDKEGHLWVGTKGAGLLCLDRGSLEDGQFRSQKLYTKSGSPLLDDSVYAMAGSRDGFWIGSDGGLNYYDYRTHSLQVVQVPQEIPYVHGIREVGCAKIWIATVGSGVYTADIERAGPTVRLKNVRRYTLDSGTASSNFFFCLSGDPEGNVWFGNRGSGLYRLTGGGMVSVPLHASEESPTVNDVFSLFSRDSTLWVGTGHGLVGLDRIGTETYFDKARGLPNNTVHSILGDAEGGLWVATNDGLARLSRNQKVVEHYGRNKGLKVNEFSDGASCSEDGELFFGGVNGWVEIRNNPSYVPGKDILPSVNFNFMSVGGKEMNLFAWLNESGRRIRLGPKENSFTVRFAVTDNVEAEQYDFLYCVSQSVPGGWINNGPDKYISFVRMRPGTYHLYVKAVNRVSGLETDPARFEFTVQAPWYATRLAKLVWTLLGFVLVALLGFEVLRRVNRRNAMQLEKMEQKHKEEMYEEKLRFFTNITHEFCTPLTLIYSPCERILAHEGTDEFVRRYVSLIQSNAVRLNSLIQEIIDYRRLETGNQRYQLVPMVISDLTREICDSFTDITADRNIHLQTDILPDIPWNMDRRCYTRILSNLMSNALKYTPEGGTIRVDLGTSEGSLVLSVFNTGKGIKEEDRRTIFNSFRILDNIEEDAMKGLTSRNGLGLAICHSTAELLKGKIEVESEEGAWARLVVTLPYLEATAEAEGAVDPGLTAEVQGMESPSGTALIPDPHIDERQDRSKPLVLVVDDHPEILAMLRESLSGSYRVKTATDGDAAIGMVKEESPDLIITDIMMPGTDGLALTRQIKQNKHTMHIPLVILSARSTQDDQVRGLLSGGDAYISKPFNISYLQAVVSRLLDRDEVLREYYNSSASAYVFTDGRLMTAEDKSFVQEMTAWVEENLGQDITVDQMADHFNLSLRNLYRKFNSLDLLPPKDFIKERRMERVARLLQTTDMTVQEVIYECGFNNRAHFYKEFEKKFGMTPKAFRGERKTKDESLR